MSQMFAGNVLKQAMVAKLGLRLNSETRSQQDQRDLLCDLTEQQNRFRRFAVRMGELNKKDVVGLGFQLLNALWQVQHEIRCDRKLPLLELLQATINCVRVTMHEKNPEGTRSVGLRSLWGGISKTKLVLCRSAL